MRRLLAVLLGACLPGAGAAEELVVAAAASLRAPVGRIAADFESESGHAVTLTFGASNLLAQQLRAGAPLDVLLAADTSPLEALAGEDRLRGDLRPFAGNRLAVLRSSEFEGSLARPEDLANPGLRRFALPNAAVPVGFHARRWLAARGLLPALGDRVLETADARATLAAVDLGHADAALVYATDARLARRARLAFEIAPDEQPEIVYAGALSASAGEGAAAFLDYVVGPGRRALLDAGFLPPPETP